MEFSNWLTSLELKNLISETYGKYDESAIFNSLLKEIFQTKGNIEILLENEEEDEGPAELADPFTGDEDAKPVDKKPEFDVEEEYRTRKHNTDLLKKLDIEDKEDRQTIIKVLVELGYIKKPSDGRLVVKSKDVDAFYNRAMRDTAKQEKAKEELKKKKKAMGLVEPIDPDLEKSLLKDLKDSMLTLRYKSMLDRKNKIEELMTYKGNVQQHLDRVSDLLSDLGYVKKGNLDAGVLSEKFEKAIKEDDNQDPPGFLRSDMQKSIDQLKKEFMEKFGELWKFKLLPIPQAGTEYLDRLVNSLTKRKVNERGEFKDWQWPRFPPNSQEYSSEDAELSLSGVRAIQNTLQTSAEQDLARKTKKERTYGVADDDKEDQIANIAANSEEEEEEDSHETAVGNLEAEQKIRQILHDLLIQHPYEGHAFCIKMGINYDSILSGSQSAMTFDVLSKNPKVGIPVAVQVYNKLPKHLLTIFAAEKDQLKINAKINKMIRDGEMIFTRKVCQDQDLKNSRWGKVINCDLSGSAVLPIDVGAKPKIEPDKTKRHYGKVSAVCSKCGTRQESHQDDIDLGRAKCKICGNRLQLVENFIPNQWQKLL